MPSAQSNEALLVEHLDRVERVAAALCRRYGFGEDDADDFRSWVKLRLVEDDYAILRKFRGESSITTYLTTVVATLMRDYRAAHWGRWRPSAAALRLGHAAVRLETLVVRDGMPLRAAAERMRTEGVTDRTDRELAAWLDSFPARGPLRPIEVGAAPLESTAGRDPADGAVHEEEAAAEQEAMERALQTALADLPAEDRLILRLRFWDGLSVADIARGLQLPQKPLYRRIERALGSMRETLSGVGFGAARARAFFEERA